MVSILQKTFKLKLDGPVWYRNYCPPPLLRPRVTLEMKQAPVHVVDVKQFSHYLKNIYSLPNNIWRGIIVFLFYIMRKYINSGACRHDRKNQWPGQSGSIVGESLQQRKTNNTPSYVKNVYVVLRTTELS